MTEVQIVSTSLVEQDEKNKREWNADDDDAHSEISEVTGETKPEGSAKINRNGGINTPVSTPTSATTTPANGVITNSSFRLIAAAAASNNNAAAGDDNMSFSSTMSRSDVLRAKLRARETRLSSLVRTASTDSATGMITQMASLKGTLEQVEQQKTLLESELSRLKYATDGDEYLKEKMDGIQEGFEKQVKKIQELEDQLELKNLEIEQLQLDLYQKLKRIVELEFDLETHDIHYTAYAAEQFKLGEDALHELKYSEPDATVSIINKNLGTTAAGQQEIKVSPKRAQRLISKLLSDLDSLENRYKQEKLQNVTKFDQINAENETLRTRMRTIEKKADIIKEEEEDHDDDDDDRDHTQGRNNNNDYDDNYSTISDDFSAVNKHDEIKLRQRIQVLDAKRSLYHRDMLKAQKDLAVAFKEHESAQELSAMNIEKLQFENETLRKRLQQVQSGQDGAATFEFLEKKVAINYQQVTRLHASVMIKDRQLETLKEELATLRLKDIATSSGDNKGKHSAQDVKTAKSQLYKEALGRSVEDEDRSGLTEATDATFLRELQQQLQEAQQQLVKKDQELVIERAKSASTAAGLLARITELSKHVPLPPTPEGSPMVGTPSRSSGSRRHSSGNRLSSLAENPKESEDPSESASFSSSSGGGRRLNFLKRNNNNKQRRSSRGTQ